MGLRVFVAFSRHCFSAFLFSGFGIQDSEFTIEE